MEFKLFVIGVLAYLYARYHKKFVEQKKLENGNFAALWNAAFCAVAFTAVGYIAMLNIQTPEGSVAENDIKCAFISAVIFIAGGAYGYLRVKLAPKKTEKLLKNSYEWAHSVYPVAIIASIVMLFFIQQFRIPSPSMRSTFLEGDRLFVNKLAFGLKVPFIKHRFFEKEIKRGDIVIFRFPADNRKEVHCGGHQYGRDFIKRVVALPGDTIEVKGETPYINGKPLENETYAQWTDANRLGPFDLGVTDDEFEQIWQARATGEVFMGAMRDYFGPVKVPEDTYFVMGDNRDHSCDSRFWGAVPKENIKGKAWFRCWPPKRMGIAR